MRWRRIMVRLERRPKVAFCAVPAFIRVEPLMISVPLSSRIGHSAAANIGAPGLLAMAMVSAPAFFAVSSAAGGGRGGPRAAAAGGAAAGGGGGAGAAARAR